MASLVGAAGAYCEVRWVEGGLLLKTARLALHPNDDAARVRSFAAEAFGIPLADLRVSGPGGEPVDDDDVCWPRDARGAAVVVAEEAPPDRPRPPRPVVTASGCEVRVRRPPDAGPFARLARGQRAKLHLVGRLVGGGGGVFEATRSLRARAPFEAEVGGGGVIAGLREALELLGLGAVADVRVPAAAAYGDNEVGKDGRTIRKRSPLDFEVHVVEVDGVACAAPGPPPRAALLEAFPPHRPQWLGRYALPGPSPEYRSFCAVAARAGGAARVGVDDVPGGARPLPARAPRPGWDGSRGAGDCGVYRDGFRRGWRAWGWDDLGGGPAGDARVLSKWRAPTLRTDTLRESPVFESGLREYVAYARAVERYDGACDVRKHASCPRCYLNGLPIFNVAPALRGDVDDRPAWLADDSEKLMAAWDATVARAVGKPAAPDAADLADRSWSLTKVFIAPPGAITRLHYDNGHAHACVEFNRWFGGSPPNLRIL